MPVSSVPQLIEEGSALVRRLAPEGEVLGYGHLGDGNLHFNVMLPPDGDHEAMRADANRVVHDLVAQYHGSISAEHGLGVLRAAEAMRFKSGVELDMLCALRQALDPRGIMNPGKGISTALRQQAGHALPCN